MILNLLFLTIIIVFIIDMSGFVNSMKFALSKILTNGKICSSNYTLKPFDCSMCMTFWCGIIYICISGQFTIMNLFYVCMFAMLTHTIHSYMMLIQDILLCLHNKIYKLL